MTQLDRLEALAERRPKAGSLSTAWAWLPDLIRVARAAKDFLESGDEGKPWIDAQLALAEAIDPLFSEVES